MITRIKNAVFVYHGLINCRYLYISDGVISEIGDKELPFDREIDANGNYVSCGFIDIHAHGGGGYDFMDGTKEDIINASKIHFAHGTTSIFPTSTSSSFEDTLNFIKNTDLAAKSECEGIPHILGSHLEGPFLSKEMAGAQNPKYIKNPLKQEYEEFIKAGNVKRISFAPELEGSNELCDFLIKKGVIPAFAHTAASYLDILPLYQKGLKLATHLYSGMNTVFRENLYRKLGAVETALLIEDISVEIIADGHHLPIELIKFILKNKCKYNIILVTDSMRGAGMPDGDSFLGNKNDNVGCKIQNGVAVLLDGSTFAGSVATADRLVRTMLLAGVSLPDAIQMITENPAKVMRLEKKGKLEIGFDADLVIFDKEINIKKVLKGRK